jgi:regulator of replication initiation timing
MRQLLDIVSDTLAAQRELTQQLQHLGYENAALRLRVEQLEARVNTHNLHLLQIRKPGHHNN